MDVQATTTLSSKSEEVLAGIQSLSIDDRVASSRAVDNSVRVEFYQAQSAFFNFDALEDIAPSSALPHFAIDSAKEDSRRGFIFFIDANRRICREEHRIRSCHPQRASQRVILHTRSTEHPSSASRDDGNLQGIDSMLLTNRDG